MKHNNNIENQFKQKLNERTIEPTDKAWDRLDAMLSVSEKKKSKRTWIWAVAGLAVLMTIGSWFFRIDNNEEIPNEQVVVESTENINYETQVRQSPISNYDINTKIETAPQKIKIDSFIKNEKLVIAEEKTDILEKYFEVPEIEEITNDNTTVNTYVSAQDLLDDVEESKPKKVLAERNNPSKISIDHKSLLYQAEQEVEENYRKNAVDRLLYKGFNNAKVALSNRNQK